MKIFCLIPAFKEKKNLEELIPALYPILSKLCSDFKIFLIIQGSDGSVNLLKKLKPKYKKLDWQYYSNALGIGAAYKTGFMNINDSFSHVLTLDADLNHDPAVLPEFTEIMKKTNADIVVGSRFVKGGVFADNRAWKKLISYLMNKIIIKLTGIKIHDISSGFRLIKRQVIDDIKNELIETGYPNYMELVIKSARRGFELAEVPITYKARKWGKSKMEKLKTMNDYLKFMFRFLLFS